MRRRRRKRLDWQTRHRQPLAFRRQAREDAHFANPHHAQRMFTDGSTLVLTSVCIEPPAEKTYTVMTRYDPHGQTLSRFQYGRDAAPSNHDLDTKRVWRLDQRDDLLDVLTYLLSCLQDAHDDPGLRLPLESYVFTCTMRFLDRIQLPSFLPHIWVDHSHQGGVRFNHPVLTASHSLGKVLRAVVTCVGGWRLQSVETVAEHGVSFLKIRT